MYDILISPPATIEQALRDGKVVADTRVPQTKSGRGSCIFLHIWSAPDKGTAGCTVMTPGEWSRA
ncbi:MAG: hypothetical protein ACYC5X_00725 [Syntrophales bacterium]